MINAKTAVVDAQPPSPLSVPPADMAPGSHKSVAVVLRGQNGSEAFSPAPDACSRKSPPYSSGTQGPSGSFNRVPGSLGSCLGLI